MRVRCGAREAYFCDVSLFDIFQTSQEVKRTGTYTVRAQIPDHVFSEFCKKVRGEDIEVTSEMYDTLRTLSMELGYHGLEGDLDLLETVPENLFDTEARVREIEGSVDDLVQKTGDLRNDIEDLQSLRSEIHAVKTSVDAVRTECLEKIGEVGKSLEELRRDLKELEKTIRMGQFSSKQAPLCLPTFTIDYDEAQPFNGILAYLTSKTGGGNLHDKGIVEVSATEAMGGKHEKFVLESEGAYISRSKDADNAFVCLNFKNMKVSVTKYVLQSPKITVNKYFFLRSWVIEVSYDGDLWDEIDRQENTDVLNGSEKVAVFTAKPHDEPIQYVRLRQIGPNHYAANNKKLTLGRIEIYGGLYGDVPKA